MTDQVENHNDNGDADALGDPGKRALDAMKRDRNAAQNEARTLREQLANSEQAIEAARTEARAEAERMLGEQTIRHAVRAAAAGRFQDPDDAVALLDLTKFKLGENGAPALDDIEKAITERLEKSPHLKASRARNWPDAEQGQRGGKEPPAQPSMNDIIRGLRGH